MPVLILIMAFLIAFVSKKSSNLSSHSAWVIFMTIQLQKRKEFCYLSLQLNGTIFFSQDKHVGNKNFEAMRYSHIQD